MTHVAGNIYSATFPGDYNHIIFNDNGYYQTSDLDVPGDGNIFISGDKDVNYQGTWEQYDPSSAVDAPNYVYFKKSESDYDGSMYAYFTDKNSDAYYSSPGIEMELVEPNIYRTEIPEGYHKVKFSFSSGTSIRRVTIPAPNYIYSRSSRG